MLRIENDELFEVHIKFKRNKNLDVRPIKLVDLSNDQHPAGHFLFARLDFSHYMSSIRSGHFCSSADSKTISEQLRIQHVSDI